MKSHIVIIPISLVFAEGFRTLELKMMTTYTSKGKISQDKFSEV